MYGSFSTKTAMEGTCNTDHRLNTILAQGEIMPISDSNGAAISLLSGHADQRYVSIGTLSKFSGLSVQVLRDYEKKGLLDSVRTLGQHRRYLLQTAVQQIFNLQNKAEEVTSGNGRPIVYARVSGNGQSKGFDTETNSSKTGQKSDLQRQVERLKAASLERYGIRPDIYSDIGSGMNDQRKNLGKLINKVLAGEYQGSPLLLTYRERLTRFNFGIFERLMIFGGVKIVILDKDEDEEKDLMVEIAEDVTALIGHMHARLNGQKAARTNTKRLDKTTIEVAVKLNQQGIAWWGIVEKLKSAGHRTLNGDVISYHVLKRNVADNLKELAPVVGSDENTNSFSEWATTHIRPKRGGHLRLVIIHAQHYSKWCQSNNIEPLTARRCSKVLREDMGLKTSNYWTGHAEVLGIEIVEE
jgi:putative resolvase